MIVAVAMRDPEGNVYSLPRPARHFNLIQHVIRESGKRYVPHAWDQGFLTDDCKFLLRNAAAMHALRCGQISEIPEVVFTSEDLW